MLARSAPLPTGSGWSFEPKWDGFRVLVSTVDGSPGAQSPRVGHDGGLARAPRPPPRGDLLLDGELVAWRKEKPYFPYVSRRVLNRDMSIVLTYVLLDVLRKDGADLMERPYSQRRSQLEDLALEGPAWTTTPVFDDGQALFAAICERGLEGVVAKKRSGCYRPGDRRDRIKRKNPDYWRREFEIEAMRHAGERRRARGCLSSA
jgi:bifunctional non-homologous end joining protein LigD